jgi:hypothetical protein
VTSSSDMRSTMLLMKEDERVLIMEDWRVGGLEVWLGSLEG